MFNKKYFSYPFLILFFFLLPLFSFAQYYFPNPNYNNSYQNQDQNFSFDQIFQNQSLPPIVFSATGSKFAFIYPTNNGYKVNFNGSLEYGPFMQVLWYGFSSDGNIHAVVGITLEGKYITIINGQRWEFDYFNNLF